ncbi:MAG: hypothetical protein AAB320_00710, partial [Elusimicrobiota bacterium]
GVRPSIIAIVGFLIIAIIEGLTPIFAQESHEAPAPSLAERPRAVSSDRQNTLAEMWQRRILPPDSDQWSPADLALLQRILAAERSGALTLLRSRLRRLQGLTAPRKRGSSDPLRLTKEGYERYLAVKSQDALRYFEKREIEAKWAFQLRDLDGKPLFDAGSGQLTEAGDLLYTRASLGEPTFWRNPSGEVQGNRPPSQAAQAQSTKAPAAQWSDYFPVRKGERRVYMVYDADRRAPAKRALHMAAYWEEVVAEEALGGGLRAVVLRISEGKLAKSDAGWDYGRPEKALSEEIYLIGPDGVDWRGAYAAASEAEYVKTRETALSNLRKQPLDALKKLMDNWILPFPAAPGVGRRSNDGKSNFRVRAGTDPAFLKAELRGKAVAVVASAPGDVMVTRWFVPGRGLVLLEQGNADPKSNGEFPVQVRELLDIRR